MFRDFKQNILNKIKNCNKRKMLFNIFVSINYLYIIWKSSIMTIYFEYLKKEGSIKNLVQKWRINVSLLISKKSEEIIRFDYQ